jgi:sec-independent protein translocase protein TatC
MADSIDDNRDAAEGAEERNGENPPTGETPATGDAQEPPEQAAPDASSEQTHPAEDARPGEPTDDAEAPAAEGEAEDDEPYDRAEEYGEDGEYHGGEHDQEEDYGYGEYDDDYAYEQDYDNGEYEDEEYEEEEEDEEEEEEEEEEEDDGQRKMTLVEHLEELRMRIIRAAIGLAIAMGASLYFSADIIKYLNGMLQDIAKEWGAPGPITIDLVAPFMMYLKMSLYVGIIFSSPWLFYQAWMFVAAGLYKHERRYVKIAVPFSTGLFVTGAAFFLFVISKYLIGFFYYFNKAILGVMPTIDVKNHITFMTNMMLVFGLCFQMPIAVFLLGKMGLVTVRMLNRYRKYVIVVIFIIAAFCTSPSPLDQIALAIPMWMLYELGVLLVYLFVEKKRREEEQAEAAEAAEEEYEDEDDDEEDEAEEEGDADEEPEANGQPEAPDDEEYDDVEPMH